MRNSLLPFVVGLALGVSSVACGGAGTREASAPRAESPTPTPSASMTSASAPPKIVLRVYTVYTDFSGHGYTARGRFYRFEQGAWLGAQCSVSHVADPEAGPSAPPMCDEWTTVPDAQWSVLEKARANSDELWCKDKPEVCAELGLAAEPGKQTP